MFLYIRSWHLIIQYLFSGSGLVYENPVSSSRLRSSSLAIRTTRYGWIYVVAAQIVTKKDSSWFLLTIGASLNLKKCFFNWQHRANTFVDGPLQDNPGMRRRHHTFSSERPMRGQLCCM